MAHDEIRERVAGARAYAEARGVLYLPCFRKAYAAPDAPYRDEPLPGWRAIKLLEEAGQLPEGTFDRWTADRALPPELANASWCGFCRAEPVASARGLCVWCEQSPLGRAA